MSPERHSNRRRERFPRVKESQTQSTLLLLVADLVAGVFFDLLRRYTKSWTRSLKKEVAVRRETFPPSDLPAREWGKKTSSIPRPTEETAVTVGTDASPPRFFHLFRRTLSQWTEDKCPQLGAALAYYTVFSLAPLILLLLGVFGLIYGSQQAREKILEQLHYLIDPTAIQVIQDIANHAAEPKPGVFATLIGIIIALFGASGIFGQLQDALNTIWSVKPKPGQGIWSFIRARFLSFGMVAGVCFLLLVSLTVEAALKALHRYLEAIMPGGHFVGLALFYLCDFAIIVLLFAMIFRYLPDAKIAWRDVWAGAVLTTVFFVIGKFLLGLYLGSGAAGSAYGAATSLVTLLLWIFYSAQILLFGAEFTRIYADSFGSHLQPDKHAVRVERKEIEVPSRSP
jgi:membrane protein